MKNLSLLIAFFLCLTACKVNKESSSAPTYSVKLTDNNFGSTILDNDDLSVVYFWATWCGPCKLTGPVIEDIAKLEKGNFTVGKVDVDKNEGLTLAYGIRSIPTVLIIKNGEEVDRYVGGFSHEVIEDLIDEHQ